MSATARVLLEDFDEIGGASPVSPAFPVSRVAPSRRSRRSAHDRDASGASTRDEAPLHLRVLNAPASSAPRRPFALAIGALLAAGLIGSLMLNTITAQNAFVIHDLQKEVAIIGATEQALAQRDAQLESPAALAARARRLGMVPSGSPVFLRLRDGRVLGTPLPAKAEPRAVAKPSAPTTPSAPTAAAAPTTPNAPAAPSAPTTAKPPATAVQTGGGTRP